MGSALLSFENTVSNAYLPRLVRYQGALFTLHADSTETGGQFALLEVEGAQGGEPPLHVHKHEDELLYILEGQLKVRRGDEEIILSVGRSGFLPGTFRTHLK